MAVFTHNVNRIRGAAYKNCGVDGTCKRGLIIDFPFGCKKEVTSQEGIVNAISIVERMCHQFSFQSQKVITNVDIIKQSFFCINIYFAL